MKPDYKTWGLSGNLEARVVSPQMKKKALSIVRMSNFLEEKFELNLVSLVDYYNGDISRSTKAVLMRFQQHYDEKSANLCGDHISFIYELNSLQLLGMTKMVKTKCDFLFSHESALGYSLEFLSRYAPDLISETESLPKLKLLNFNEKMTFKPRLKTGLLELHWIGPHSERFSIRDKFIDVLGMKVKFYCPADNSWTWVVVSGVGEVITFEKNIKWNF